jgi:ribosomal protein S18 acetylase RimI-like enzyme
MPRGLPRAPKASPAGRRCHSQIELHAMVGDQFTIREATGADLPAAAALGAQLIRLHHEWDAKRFAILSPHLETGYARFLDARLRDPQAVVLVAESEYAEHGRELAGDSTQIVGYAYGQVEGPSWPDLLDVHGKFHDLFVRSDQRGRGVGTALVSAMVERLNARGAPQIVLMTASANASARSLFERLGFRATMIEMTLEQ